MVQTKQSFKDVSSKKRSAKPAGQELGAVIENDPKNYPPTGQWRDQKPVIDRSVCIGCGICVANCPEAAICLVATNGKKKAKVDYAFCKGEGLCAQVCPVKAIKMQKE